MRAAFGGYLDVVRELIDTGAEINAKNKYGNTALMRAARGGHAEIVRELLKEGADIDAKNIYGNTALMRSAVRGHIEVVKVLIDAGAVIDAQNNSCQTALTWAAGTEKPNINVINMLLNAGADPHFAASAAWGNPALKGTEVLRRIMEASR